MSLSKSKIFLIACLSFIFGTAAASFLPLSYLGFKASWFAAGLFFLVLAALRPKVWLLFLCLAAASLAVWRYGLSLPENAPDKIWHYNGHSVTIQGYVSAEPDVRETGQKLKIETLGLVELPNRNISGKILVTTGLFPEYQYGDRLELDCRLELPEKIKDFFYDRYLARYDIYSVCYWPKIKILPGRAGNPLYRKIFSLKAAIAGVINAGLPEPESSLARPIVFGGQQSVEPSLRDDFQKTGLTHVMAVSGFNVSILSAIVMSVLLAAGASRRSAFYLAVAILAAYIILVGLPASAMRAGLMGFLVLWALKLGRLNKMTNSLVLAAAVLLLINPKLLRDDAGFQLSFLAIAGLVYVYPLMDGRWQKARLPKFKGLSDALLITLAAQVFTLPILAYNFSRVSLISPFANLAVLWTLPPLTILILAALPLAWLIPSLSIIFFLPGYVLTKYILWIVGVMARIPFASIEVDYLSLWWMAAYYAVVIWLIVKFNRDSREDDLLLTSSKSVKI